MFLNNSLVSKTKGKKKRVRVTSNQCFCCKLAVLEGYVTFRNTFKISASSIQTNLRFFIPSIPWIEYFIALTGIQNTGFTLDLFPSCPFETISHCFNFISVQLWILQHKKKLIQSLVTSYVRNVYLIPFKCS